MKISVSLPAEDVTILDEFARTAGLSSRSAALHRAVQMLRFPTLEQDYAAAWEEWATDGDDAAWETTVSDGVPVATR